MERIENALVDLNRTIREANRLPPLPEKPIMVSRSTQAAFVRKGIAKLTQTEGKEPGVSKAVQTEVKFKDETKGKETRAITEKRRPETTAMEELQLIKDLATTSDEDISSYEDQQLKLLEKEINRRKVRRESTDEYVPTRVHYPPRSNEFRGRKATIHPYRPSSTITRPEKMN